jgi:hypothetical protein
MEWSGRVPAPPAWKLARGAEDKEHAMSQNPNIAVAVVGIDIGKNSFHSLLTSGVKIYTSTSELAAQ